MQQKDSVPSCNTQSKVNNKMDDLNDYISICVCDMTFLNANQNNQKLQGKYAQNMRHMVHFHLEGSM